MTDQRAPRFGRIIGAIDRYGVRRSKLYGLAQKHRGLFLKDGTTTIVDFWKLDEILGNLPPAEFSKSNSENDTAA